jgi:hypothetical protein
VDPFSERIIVGVDQTGAAQQGGKSARPLPVAAIRISDDQMEYLSPPEGVFALSSLSVGALLKWGGPLVERAWAQGKVVLVVDAVLGLPHSVWQALGSENLYALFDRASREGGECPYGRPPAERFFRQILLESGWSEDAPLPQRQPEVLAGANSVFQTRPYQKNIQTGTHRIWVDLARDPRWRTEARIFPEGGGPSLENGPLSNWILEGYPSLSWKRVLGSPVRNPQNFGALLKEFHPRVKISEETLSRIQRSPDLADAAVLALAGAVAQLQGSLFPNLSHAPQEGWILGLEPRLIDI